MTGRAGRAAKYSSGWQSGSVKEAVDKIAPGSSPVTTDTGKILYKNPKTCNQVVYDIEGNYYTIENTSYSGGRKYQDIDGNPIPNNVVNPNGKQRGLTHDEYKQITHFNNTDTDFPYDMK